MAKYMTYLQLYRYIHINVIRRLDKCTRIIRIKYDFKDTEFQREITFEDKLMGTVQLGSKVYNAGDIMKYKYNKELLEMELTILFPVDEKICGQDLSWNIFINDEAFYR